MVVKVCCVMGWMVALLSGRWRESSSGLVTVGSGGGRGTTPEGRGRTILTTLGQIGPVWKGRAPLFLIRPAIKFNYSIGSL